MATLPALLLLGASLGSTEAFAASRCEAARQQIDEGRSVRKGLRRSRASLLRQRRARLRGVRTPGKTLEQINWMLGPIEAQLQALGRDLPTQERAYLRCVEDELDRRPPSHQ